MKTIKFILNGQTKFLEVEKPEHAILSYEGIRDMVGKTGVVTLTYYKADQPKSEGSLIAGQQVQIGQGTVINCMHTNNA